MTGVELPDDQVARVEFDVDRLRALEPGDPCWQAEMLALGTLVWGAFQMCPDPQFVISGRQHR